MSQFGSGTNNPNVNLGAQSSFVDSNMVQNRVENNSAPVDKIAQIGAALNRQRASNVNSVQQNNLNQSSIQMQAPSPAAIQNTHQMPSTQMIQGTTSEQHLSSLKDSFIQSANTLTAFYKQSCSAFNLAYYQGKQDAYEEVFCWFMSQGQNGQFKHVSVNQFNQFMQERMNSNTQNGSNGVISTNIEDLQSKYCPNDGQGVGSLTNEQALRDLMPPPDNRPPKYNLDTRQNQQEFFTVGPSLSHDHQEPTSEDLIEMTANQCMKESQYNFQPNSINKKVNTNMFQSMKFAENKKRMRPTVSQNVGVQQQQLPQSNIIGGQQNVTQMDQQMSTDQSEQIVDNREFTRIKRRNIMSNNSHLQQIPNISNSDQQQNEGSMQQQNNAESNK